MPGLHVNRYAAAAGASLLGSVVVAVALLLDATGTTRPLPTPPPVASPTVAATGGASLRAPTPEPLATPTPGPVQVSVVILEPNYTVQQGDTLGALARRAGMTTEGLAALNRLSNRDNLSVGQRLIVPES